MIRTLAVVVALLASAGCSGSSSDDASSGAEQVESPSSSAATSTAEEGEATSLEGPAATGPKISGTGYSYHVPEGWGEPDQPVPGLDPDTFAMNREDKDDFADNVNVLVFPGGALTPEKAEEVARDQLSGVGVKEVVVNDRVEIAGSTSAHVTGQASINDIDYTIEQFYPTDDDQAFVVTFSFSTDVTAEERAQITDSTLVSWEWSD